MAATSCPTCHIGYDDEHRSDECPHELKNPPAEDDKSADEGDDKE